ncbi:polycomb group RING finger protein 3-like isoform X1 [Amphibalanus amphitrite]|uniref:polycomb group RING finger protein 3-like isoform X2 n=1 Tax=Amphibalanus amphitrite TaxID=1232801 RepID=UPI001C9081B7|nr:polycomb group RING finger protein 3-like isoform X2 [Amphibalanus amphitrite]XP_043210636.1 polycomb group RING finger protein 3-like isoform X1 [Amphibalanus amphitrite]
MEDEKVKQETMEVEIKLEDINPNITCKICKGYFVDATTITECLHTFCKSCLVKHLEERNTCPECNSIIHQSHPLQYISFDRTMQDIVYKLVPNILEDEMERERAFYKSRGLPNPKDQTGQDDEANGGTEEAVKGQDYHRLDEQVNISLECSSSKLSKLSREHIRCSAQATITHLKKFVALKILNSMDKYKEIDIFCNDEMLGKDHTLKFVFVTRWRFKDPPMQLCYQPRVDV